MKNIFKKTAGVMLASSMLCVVMATGCGKEVSDTTDKNAGASSANSEPAQQTTDKSVEASSEIDYENLEFAQQTLVDKVTGIEVSGMLPVGAEIASSASLIDMIMFSDRWDPPYTVEEDFPELTAVEAHYIEYGYEKKIDNIAKIINRKNWADEEPTLGGKLNVSIVFIKDYEILDFESDLTVTLPFNYRRGMVTGGLTGEPVVVQYDYDDQAFVGMESVSAENTPKGMFQFKAKGPGRFFISNQDGIDGIISFYTDYEL